MSDDLKDIKTLSDEVSKTAREKGSAYHRAVEFIMDQIKDEPKFEQMGVGFPIPKESFERFLKLYNQYSCKVGNVERPFASKKYGYGGRIDWTGVSRIDGGSVMRYTILDYKTQNTKGSGQFKVYGEVQCQLAAYAYGIKKPHALLGTFFFDTSIPGNVELIYHPDNDEYFYSFMKAFHLWCAPVLGKNFEV